MTTHKIEVIGSGCKKCKALFELTKEVAKELNISDEVEYSTDITKAVKMGMMSSPVLAIDNAPVLAGVLPDREKLKTIISEHTGEKDVDNIKETNTKSDEPKKPCCSCDGKC